MMPDLLARLQAALADRYRIQREIGRGGMATVYLAEDLKHRRPVAVKVLRPELSATLGTERFVREIEIAAKLSHPHILPLFDSGEADGFLYYVMPFVEGDTLRERLDREGRLPQEHVIRITDDVAAALSYAHERGIVHRDIKPENIMLTGDRAVVADFGIARAVSAAGGERLTGTGIAVGTPAYMSPEQALGTGEVDARTDVYALGCVVYEMVGGDPPFKAATPQGLLAMHAAETAPRLRSVAPAVPLFIERAVERALAKEPAERFQTPRAFAEALTTGAVVARPRRRRWSWRAPAAVAAVVLLAVAGWLLATGSGGPRFERLAVLPLTNLTDDPDQEYLVDGVHEALIAELGKAGVKVISRRSTVGYRNTAKSTREIAAELGVDGVIEGSVFREGDSLEIDARLIDPTTDTPVWSRAFDGDLANVVALYRGFARAIAERIELVLSPQAEERLESQRATRPETYEAYLKGTYYLQEANPDAHEQGMAILRAALENDPADPVLNAALAQGYITEAHGPAPPVDALPLARAYAERALRLDSTLGLTHTCLAFVEGYYDWEWETADQDYRRTLAINPSLAMAHYWWSWQLFLFDDIDEAIHQHILARESDPLNPLHTAWLGWLYVNKGQFDLAEAEARRALELNPDYPIAHLVLAEVLLERGMEEDAIATAQQAMDRDSSWAWVTARMYALTGHTADARRIVAQLERQTVTPYVAYELAVVHAALGDLDDAFRWLDYERPHAWAPWFRVDRIWTHVQDDPSDPRFQAALHRMHLPPLPGG